MEGNKPYLQEDSLEVWYSYLTQPWTEHLVENNRFQILITALVCYLCYYLLHVVHKPVLISSGGSFAAKIKANVPVLEDYYWPTWWGFQAHMQTVFRVVFKSKPFVPYEREEVDTPDGGILSLQWVYNDKDNVKFPDAATRPTFVLLPGLTGKHNTSYSIHLVLTATNMGYRSVVHMNRGYDVKLKTPRTMAATKTDDFKTVLQTIKKRYPQSPVIAVGVSLGGMILTRYLCEVKDEEQPVVSAFVVSALWNSFMSTKSLELPLNWLLFNRHLTWNLQGVIKSNYHVFKANEGKQPYKIEDVLKARTIRQYDERLITPMFGYSSIDEYYKDASLDSCLLEKISVPTLFLNSEDDPFAPGQTIPFDKIRKCESLALVLTKYGGHIGFISGFFVKNESLVEKLFAQFNSFIMESKVKQ